MLIKQCYNVTAMHNVITTGQSASLARELIQSIVATGRVTCQSNDIRLPTVRQNSCKRQFVYRAAGDYDLLPPPVRALSRTRFAAAVKSDCLPAAGT